MKLFEPGRIGDLAIKNRLVMAPMAILGLTEPDGRLSQRAIDYYEARAKGGVGLIVTSATFVTREFEDHLTIPLVESNIHLSRLSELADVVHDYGAKVAIQLSAGFGLVNHPKLFTKAKPIGPSALPCFWMPDVTAREMSVEEIEKLISAFKVSAELIKRAGIDAIELHGHEGYLFDQFKTKLWNRRNDKYGGDLRGRMQFSIEVMNAIREGAGKDFPIIYRFGIRHYIPGGREDEEGLAVARLLEQAGASALHIDAGCYETWYWAHPPTTQPPGCMVDVAEMTKKAVDIPVIAVGKLGYPSLAEEVIEEGKADFVAIGRALLADPEWPNKVKEGCLDEIRPCIGDHEGCLSRVNSSKYLSCTVNPTVGMEREFALKPAEKKKSVLIIGGGPAGLEVARVSALRGHSVTLWEKGDNLGGNLIPASVPGFKQDYRMFLDYLTTQVKKLGVSVQLNKVATPESVYEEKPEAVFIATGASPSLPDITGIDKNHVTTAIDVLLGRGKIGNIVLIIGGGLVGSELALHLSQQGRSVTIVEILGSIAEDMDAANRTHLLKLLDDHQVKVLTESQVMEIKDGSTIIGDRYGRRSEVEVDDVVIATGMFSNNDLYDAVKDKLPEVYVVGDCVAPRKVLNAIWEGFRTARLI
jgi:2-enoate reductase